jgi:hypothetical protein
MVLLLTCAAAVPIVDRISRLSGPRTFYLRLVFRSEARTAAPARHISEFMDDGQLRIQRSR